MKLGLHETCLLDGKPKEDLEAITDEQLGEAYEAGYWNKCRCNDLPDGVDYVVFDASAMVRGSPRTGY